MPLSANRQLSDIEGWVLVRRRLLSKRRRLYLRLNGSVITVQQTPKAPIDWHVSLLDASLSIFPRRGSILVTLATGSRVYLQPNPSDTCQKWFQALTTASVRHFDRFYSLCEKIGEGAFASVHKATRKSDNKTVAVKVIKKRQFDMQMTRELHREMYTMKQISHYALISAHDVFNTPDKVLIVMDYMRGGTLKDNIQNNGASISESEARPIIRQILDACAYLHSNGYVHRDLKLENVLCERQEIYRVRVRLADFGYVNFIDHPKHSCLRSLVGTPVYVAPEIINRQQYGAPVDIYAVGVMLHRMLLGCYPYEGKDDETTLALALKGNICTSAPLYQGLSRYCKTFIQDLLRVSPSERITATDALKHPWIRLDESERELYRHSRNSSSSNASHSLAMMSPVTPDLSLRVKESYSKSVLKALRENLPCISSKKRDVNTVLSGSEKKTISSPQENIS